ncbi:hypothetical protein BRADI_3g35535v3 [Brachypodium distachyon]|uniref:Pectinesterase inhibitor domain-containing protein n=1 Tax=Brachypodium distachyon TaxID=15368 RepID=A0A0Q3HXJ7_BRADI|nr:hypothetical protein BRADI_3g35535v3 [Brachypodium distachyon]
MLFKLTILVLFVGVTIPCSYWRRQLAIAEVARRVDILCHHIYWSYRLLEGSSHFKELHDIIEDAKGKLESEVGPLDGMSAKMAHGMVSRLCGGSDVQKLCTLAIQKADEWLSYPALHLRDSLPAECRFRFVDITTSSSLVIILKETTLALSDTIKETPWHHVHNVRISITYTSRA